jgi:hypothetical protein
MFALVNIEVALFGEELSTAGFITFEREKPEVNGLFMEFQA